MNSVSQIVVYTGTFVILISTILAFRLRKKENTPAYFHFFYLLPAAGLLLSFNAISKYFIAKENKPLFFMMQNILDVADFILTGIFAYSVLKYKHWQKSLAGIFGLCFLCLIYYVVTRNIMAPLLEMNILMNVFIFSFCLMYYFGLFKSHPSLKLANEPTFWIVTGLFFYATVNLPLFAAFFLFRTHFTTNILSALLQFINIFIIIKHFFFIKAYRAATRLPKEVVITDEDMDYKFPGM